MTKTSVVSVFLLIVSIIVGVLAYNAKPVGYTHQDLEAAKASAVEDAISAGTAFSADQVEAAKEEALTSGYNEVFTIIDASEFCRTNNLTGFGCANGIASNAVPFAAEGAGQDTARQGQAPEAPLAVEMPAVLGVPQPEQLSAYEYVVRTGVSFPVGIALSPQVQTQGETKTFRVWFEQAATNVLLQKIAVDDELLSMRLISPDGTVRDLLVESLGISPMYCNVVTGQLDLGADGGPALVQALINRGINPTCIDGKNVTEAIGHNLWAGYLGNIEPGTRLEFEVQDQYALEIGVSLILSNTGPMDPWTRDLFTGVNMAP